MVELASMTAFLMAILTYNMLCLSVPVGLLTSPCAVDRISYYNNNKLTWLLFSGRDASRRASILVVDILVVFLRSSLSWSTFLNTSLNFSVNEIKQKLIQQLSTDVQWPQEHREDFTFGKRYKCCMSLLTETKTKQNLVKESYFLSLTVRWSPWAKDDRFSESKVCPNTKTWDFQCSESWGSTEKTRLV